MVSVTVKHHVYFALQPCVVGRFSSRLLKCVFCSVVTQQSSPWLGLSHSTPTPTKTTKATGCYAMHKTGVSGWGRWGGGALSSAMIISFHPHPLPEIKIKPPKTACDFPPPPSPLRVQEPCESRGGRPGLSVLMSLTVSVDVKLY